MTDQELNEQVARKLGRIVKNHRVRQGHNDCYYWEDIPDYCHSIEAAWEIVEAMKTKYRAIGICAPMGEGFWSCEVYERGERIAGEGADTAPMAICLAFLKLND